MFNFDLFFKQILERDSEQESEITYSLTTIDFTIQLRDLFMNNLNTKHLNIEDLSSLYFEIKEDTNYSDMTKYCLAYLLTSRLKDPMFLIDFQSDEKLNVRWLRIIFVDLKVHNLEKKLSEKVLNKIQKRQGKNKDYIKKQFKDSAIKHLQINY